MKKKTKKSKICRIPSTILEEVIDRWWNTWHRFASEDESPPDYIFGIMVELALRTNNIFDLERGTWNEK